MNCVIRLIQVSLIFIFLGSTNCKTPPSFELPAKVTTFSDVFIDFWGQMNTKYVYWSIDSTNWDQIYYKYYPVFQKLDINKPEDCKKSVSYFREITKGIIDSHFTISFTYPSIQDSLIYPAYSRKKSEANYRPPYSYLSIDSSLFDPGYHVGYDITDSPTGQATIAVAAVIQKNILYFNCNQFYLSKSYYSGSNNGVKPVLDFFFNTLRGAPQLKAVIIDVRNNFGGDVSDLNFFLGHITQTPVSFGFTRNKINLGRLDYTPWVSAQVNPADSNHRHNLPIIALADNFSVSLAEAVAMAVHSFSFGKIVGETTWGATGPLSDTKLFNGGSFSVGGFLSVESSCSQFQYLDRKSYESIGFPPDVAVPFNLESIKKGKDDQLLTAIQIIEGSN
jgi:hypothetical protein